MNLPVGTLLLDPGDASMSGLTRPTIWTVSSARKLISTVDGIVITGTLTKPGLPKGWRVINGRALAQQMKAAPDAAVKGILGPAGD